jgi:hypothetical protein
MKCDETPGFHLRLVQEGDRMMVDQINVEELK